MNKQAAEAERVLIIRLRIESLSRRAKLPGLFVCCYYNYYYYYCYYHHHYSNGEVAGEEECSRFIVDRVIPV